MNILQIKSNPIKKLNNLLNELLMTTAKWVILIVLILATIFIIRLAIKNRWF